jgi:hypothetical protein
MVRGSNVKKFALAIILALGSAAVAHAAVTGTTMVSPAPGSTLTSPTITFTWNAGAAGTTGYGLNVGTTLGGADLINIGPLQGTSVTVNVPTNVTTIYVRLWTELGANCSTACAFNDYIYTESIVPTSALTGLSCTAPSSATVACTVTIAPAAPSGGVVVTLLSGSNAITVPSSVTVAAGDTSASFSGTVNPVVLTAQAGTVTETSTVNLAAVVTVAYEVNLTWDAPETSPDPVVGYEVFRAPGDSTMYSQINIDPVTVTAFTDDAVVEGTYDYVVESVDAAGINSAPSNVAQVPVP